MRKAVQFNTGENPAIENIWAGKKEQSTGTVYSETIYGYRRSWNRIIFDTFLWRTLFSKETDAADVLYFFN